MRNRYKPYPQYKPSGVEWLGEVPEHWEASRLGKYFDERREKVSDKEYEPLSVTMQGIVLRLETAAKTDAGDKDTVNAVEDGAYPFFVRSQTVERINSCAFNCEAVLTAGDGAGVGKVFHHYTGPFDFHQRVYMMNRFQKISGRFFFFYLREQFAKVALEGNAKSTVDSLRMPLLMDFPFTIPSLHEQLPIIEFIESESAKIDHLIAKAEQAIELMKERRTALISAAVTGKVDVRGAV